MEWSAQSLFSSGGMGGMNDMVVDDNVSMTTNDDVYCVMSSETMTMDAENITSSEFDYDLIVIGGGSGGLSCAKTSANKGARVACFDYVKPSPQGTTWGLGGTCVNVGCIPKKLMHYSASLGATLDNARNIGWDIPEDEVSFEWEKMQECVGNYIHMTNFGYQSQLRDRGVTYINALASFADPHTVRYEENNEEKTMSAAYIVLAVGGRPFIPNIEGANLAITSDDIFWQKENPGKTLCIGGGYIALETAGFLSGMGLPDVHVMARSILLRGFDRECVQYVEEYLTSEDIVIRKKCVPTKLEPTEDDRIRVTYTRNGNTLHDVYDTVMFATGRRADTAGLNTDAAGLEILLNGKLNTTNEQTNVEHIFAIGDINNDGLELTPVAIQAGKYLAKRLFAGSTRMMDYTSVATTVFTPLEYGCVGMSEEEAVQTYGPTPAIECFVSKFEALEQSATHKLNENFSPVIQNPHFAKLIVLPAENNRVVGFHYVGPNAGEVTQGFSLAIKLGATKDDFDDVVGIHPTAAEVFTTLSIKKSDGIDYNTSGCAT